MERITNDVCVRVQGFVSLDLDGELSEFERSIIDAHVEECAACREFSSAVAAWTSALRAAPLESVAYSFSVARRPSRLAPLSAVAATAVAVFVAGFATALSPSGANDPGITNRAELHRTVDEAADGVNGPSGGPSIGGSRAA